MPILQPVGGMDRIAEAMERKVKQLITFGTEVKEIRKTPNGVRIVYVDFKTGQRQQVFSDYCIYIIPFFAFPKLFTYKYFS